MARTVIIGAGIVGSTTAYFLSQHPKFDKEKDSIVIFEACYPAAGASGKAGGLLSNSCFPQELGALSFDLHAKLAKKYNGRELWDYREFQMYSFEGSTNESSRKSSKPIPDCLEWLDKDFTTDVQKVGNDGEWAQIHPYKFTTFILNKALEHGVKLVNGKVLQLLGSESTGVTGVSYTLDNQGPDPLVLESDKVIVTAGPWTNTIVKDAKVYGAKVNSIILDTDKPLTPCGLFTNMCIDGVLANPEIYPRRDEVYICGSGTDDPLPPLANQVQIDEAECETLFEQVSHVSERFKNGTVKKTQACFLPSGYTQLNAPFLGETNASNLYLSAGHSVWGISNGPATGYLLAELIFGSSASSLGIERLSPKTYFDSSGSLRSTLELSE